MTKMVTDKAAIAQLLSRGVEEAIVREHLEAALMSGKQLRVKFGIDPTSPDLHLGHGVPLRKLRQFQDLGHKAVLIIGDYTARIGDPTGRSEERKPLTSEQVQEHMREYLAQAGTIIDIKEAEIRYNSEWFSREGLSAVLEAARAATVQQMLHRADFKKRMEEDNDISVMELLYPVLQGYDSVRVKADVEIGGTDQKFNLLIGRRVQRHYAMAEQDIMTLPLLVGLDGALKMSKSKDNYIGLTESANVMFGKIMSVPDELIDSYYALCTDTERTTKDPREAKLALGEIIVDMYHGKGEGKKAAEEFVRVFSKKEKPEDRPKIKKAGNKTIVESLILAEIAVSKSDARRLVEQGGVRVNDEVVKDPKAIVPPDVTVQVGPRRFYDT